MKEDNHYKNLVNRIPIGTYLYVTSPNGSQWFEFVSYKFCQIYDIKEEDFLRDPSLAFSVTHPEYHESLIEANQYSSDTNESFCWEGRFIVNDKVTWVEISSEPSFLPNGETLWSGVIKDVTERMRLEQQVREQKLLLDTVLNNIDTHVYMKDSQRRYLYVNPYTAELFNKSPEEIIGKLDEDLMPKREAEQYNSFDTKVLAEGHKKSGEESFVEPDGSVRYYWSKKIPISEKGKVTSYVGISSDITEIIKLREKFKYLANTDELTGIKNRRLLMEMAEQELDRMHRFERTLAVILFDIDKFKSINDSYGHIAGDCALKAAVEKCKPILRDIDLFGRLGGDEFVIILPEVSLRDALHVAERLRKAIAETSIICNDCTICSGFPPVCMSASFGVVLSDRQSSIDHLLAKADMALYKAKEQGRNCVEYEQEEY